jgi:predicted Zn finger-like uncharacterized protein
MVSSPLTDGWYVLQHESGPERHAASVMLIVCPSCATSYMIDPASVGPAGRTVRCARCKGTWFVGPTNGSPDVAAFVDGVIAEAEAQTGGRTTTISATVASHDTPSAPHHSEPADDFGAESDEPIDDAPLAPPPPAVIQPPHIEDHQPMPEEAAENPVAVTDSPSLVPPIEHEPFPEPAGTELDAEDIESFAARRERLQVRRKHKRSSSRWTAIILVLAAFNVALIGARSEVVHYLPQTASLFAAIGLPVNVRHLAFEGVKISKDVHDGVNILIVEGTIVSKSDKATEVPRLRFAARNATGQEVYTWSALPERSILGPGETLAFRSQLASPPAEATDVLVRFFNAQDVAGTK